MCFYFEDSCKTISDFPIGEVGCLTYQDNDTFKSIRDLALLSSQSEEEAN